MPYKFATDKTPIPEGKDRRIKLTNDQRLEISENIEGLSQRKLAEKYQVSRRLIQFILSPEKKAENLQARENRGGWKQYYIKDQHTKAIREHRQYKKTILSEVKDNN